MRITGVITQGAKRIGSPEYIKSYKIAYSNDGKLWATYKVKGTTEDMVSHCHQYKSILNSNLVKGFYCLIAESGFIETFFLDRFYSGKYWNKSTFCIE